MAKELKAYFPVIRSREEVLDEIRKNKNLESRFDSWSMERQEEFLNVCTGVKGVRLLYDVFFKTFMDPNFVPERLESLLSLLLKQEVKIMKVLPNESMRIAAESTLLIMDIVVQFKDGSIANVEVQKIGYRFPGERCACYSSDLLLRQYKRMKKERKKSFSYKHMKNVYTIVFFEQSPREFHEFKEVYLHHFSQKSDTGLKMNLLQEFFFIPLDILKEITHNNGINSKLEAWLTFLCEDEPGEIEKLILAYPEFIPLYKEIYNLCGKVEQMMGLFSEELYEMDKNTVQLMIDEMQDTIDAQANQLEEKTNTIDEQASRLDAQANMIDEQEKLLRQAREEIEKLKKQLKE